MNIITTRILNYDAVIFDALASIIDDPSGIKPSIKHFVKMLNDERTYLLIATINEELVGYALAYRFPSLYNDGYLAYLYDIEVKIEYRRKGVGRKLIETVLLILKGDNVTELWLGTAVNNPEGQALFAATGAERSEEVFNDFTYILS